MSTTEWLTLILAVVQVLMGVIGAGLLFFMRTLLGELKDIGSDLKELGGKLHEFQIMMANNAVMREPFEQYRQETRQRIHDLGDKCSEAVGAVRILREVMSDFIGAKRTL